MNAQKRKSRLARCLARQNGLCALCGKPITEGEGTIDHVVPLSKGGSPNSTSNLQAAHWTCNNARGDAPITDTQRLEWIMREVPWVWPDSMGTGCVRTTRQGIDAAMKGATP